MKTAKCTLWLNKGHSLMMPYVTPAEVQLLISMHHANYGGNPVEDLVETGEEQRSNRQELGRLLLMYPNKRVKQLYPGADPRLPETFEEVMNGGIIETEDSGYVVESGGSMPSGRPPRGDE